MNSQVLKRFRKRKSSVIGGIIILIFVITALIGPSLCKQDPTAIDLPNKYKGPSAKHWLGTDNLGRDTFTRLVHGARVSLAMSVVSVFVGSFIGVLLGVLAGYYGGWIDAVISRFIDLLLAFPGLLLAIAVVAVLGNGILNTMAAIAFYSIPYVARLVRGLVISLKHTEFIQACKVIGASDFRIIAYHIIPNTMGQIIIDVTLSLGTAILTASSLSFLGLGVQPPNPEWGAMLSQAREVIRSTPLAAIAPGTAITLVVLSFSLVGDGLRDALDPKLKNS